MVNKWVTFGHMVFEEHVAHLLTLEFCFQNVFLKPCCFKNLILPAERILFEKQKHIIGTCGPLIDPTTRKMWPTY